MYLEVTDDRLGECTSRTNEFFFKYLYVSYPLAFLEHKSTLDAMILTRVLGARLFAVSCICAMRECVIEGTSATLK